VKNWGALLLWNMLRSKGTTVHSATFAPKTTKTQKKHKKIGKTNNHLRRIASMQKSSQRSPKDFLANREVNTSVPKH